MFKSLLFGTALLTSVYGHTSKICVEVVDQTVTFYGGSWDAHSFLATTTGGVVLSNGPTGNGRYDFTSTLTDTNDEPTGVDLTNFACTQCVTTQGVSYWQQVVIDGLTCGATYDVTTTTDTAIEYPACTFPSITIPECGCDETMDIKCRASGDPHFTTWDTSRHHFQGVGYYDYITACSADDLFPFTITARQEECGRWAPMTCVTEVRVTLSDGTVIVFPQNGNANPTWLSTGASAVGDDQTFVDGTFSVQPGSFSGSFVDPDLDDTEITVMFTYNGYYFRAMTSSDCMMDRICGVCGNVDGDSTNDFEKRDGTIVSNDGAGKWRMSPQVWNNTFCFGDSWCNEDFTNNPDCEPTDVPPQCDAECIDVAYDYCEQAWDEYCGSECSSDELTESDWVDDCTIDACVASGCDLGNYGYDDAVNNGFFDAALGECQEFCDISGENPFENECYHCADQCSDLTTEWGCANNQCLDTCRYCISGIDWDDYSGGQSNQCQCHNNGCDQCDEGWFKLDFDFPCQSCAGLIGCSHCTDFYGCQQCEQGYTMVEHASCGEDSFINTGNTKFHYCVPDDSTNGLCVIGDLGLPTETPATPAPTVTAGDDCPNIVQCGSNPCDCSTDSNCDDCQSWGCNTCAGGYYKQSFGYECASCYDAYEGKCDTCSDWQGCTLCAAGYSHQWSQECGTNICV